MSGFTSETFFKIIKNRADPTVDRYWTFRCYETDIDKELSKDIVKGNLEYAILKSTNCISDKWISEEIERSELSGCSDNQIADHFINDLVSNGMLWIEEVQK